MKKSWRYYTYMTAMLLIGICCFIGVMDTLYIHILNLSPLAAAICLTIFLALMAAVALGAVDSPSKRPYGTWILAEGEYYVLKSCYTSGSTAGSLVIMLANPLNQSDILCIKIDDGLINAKEAGGIYYKKGTSLVLTHHTQESFGAFKKGDIDWSYASG